MEQGFVFKRKRGRRKRKMLRIVAAACLSAALALGTAAGMSFAYAADNTAEEQRGGY